MAENLVKHHHALKLPGSLTIYCSSRNIKSRDRSFLSAELKYIPFGANGAQSVIYDLFSLLSSVWHRHDVILLLGVSGAIALPLIRTISSAHIITNLDGIEWRRDKWRGLAKWFLRLSEKIAVRFSHELISDNLAIADYIKGTYGLNSHIIVYGGDHAVQVEAESVNEYVLPENYAISVCRIEPENNVHVILEAFSSLDEDCLVVVGNWDNSEYGRALRKKYSACKRLYLFDPIYDLGKLKTLRARASFYVHGHSAGGTNPSLVEAMHFGIPMLVFDCNFNRNTTEDKALFFMTCASLVHLIKTMDATEAERVGRIMLEIAERRYTWKAVAQQYFMLFSSPNVSHKNF